MVGINGCAFLQHCASVRLLLPVTSMWNSLTTTAVVLDFTWPRIMARLVTNAAGFHNVPITVYTNYVALILAEISLNQVLSPVISALIFPLLIVYFILQTQTSPDAPSCSRLFQSTAFEPTPDMDMLNPITSGLFHRLLQMEKSVFLAVFHHWFPYLVFLSFVLVICTGIHYMRPMLFR